MGNICSDNSEKTKTKQNNNNEPFEKKVTNNNEIYKVYSQIYKDYDIYSTNELFQDSYTGICRIIDIYDGDTCKIALNFINGVDVVYRFTVRLLGVDTPEIKTKNEGEKKAAIEARNKLLTMIIKGGKKSEDEKYEINEKTTSSNIKNILTDNIFLAKIETQGFDKYGRLLANIYPYNSDDYAISYNQILLDEKHAYSYDGGTKQKFK
jgi:endonuclease YncB( thermonuclease family)